MENAQKGKSTLTVGSAEAPMFLDEAKKRDPRQFASRLPASAFEKPIITPTKKPTETVTDSAEGRSNSANDNIE